MGGGGLGASALQGQGIPQALDTGVGSQAGPTPDPETFSEAMKMLQAGGVGAEKFLAILAQLAGQIIPEIGQDQGQPQQLQAPQGQPSIADLLGG